MQAQKLKKFKSTIAKKIGPKEINIPYTKVYNYLEYLDGSNQDNIIDEQKKVQLYIWIPIAVNEIGLRMVSPAERTKVKNAVKSKAYEQHAKSSDTLDTSIQLERSNIIDIKGISEEKIKNTTWTVVDSNQNAKDMLIDIDFAADSGHSVERYITRKDQPLKAVTRGLYRVNFKIFRFQNEKGTFLGQIGFPIKIPGIIVARNIDDLKTKLVSQ